MCVTWFFVLTRGLVKKHQTKPKGTNTGTNQGSKAEWGYVE